MDAQGKPVGAPESYADFTLPEGVTVNPEQMNSFKATAKELGLTQEAAQRLVTFNAQAQAAQFQAMVQGWEGQAKADKEFGGDKFEENLAVATKAVERFGSPEFKAWLNQTGLGNHPEFIRAFYRAGKAISEDGFVPGRAGQSGGESVAQRMFPNMNP